MATVYLIPSLLAEEGLDAIPAYIPEAIKKCQVFFVENERTTRRYFKQIWKAFLPGQEIVIDEYEWFVISDNAIEIFKQKIKEAKIIGIISEAGPRSSRSRAGVDCHRPGNECGCKAIGRSQLNITGINGKWNEWTAVPFCRLFTNRQPVAGKSN